MADTETVTETVEVPAKSADLGKHLGNFLKAAKQAAADGWQAGQDIPVYLSATLSDLIPAAAEISSVVAEAKTDWAGVGLAIGIEIEKAIKG
jgi:hypothetical protein